jgi:hypothetical protein
VTECSEIPRSIQSGFFTVATLPLVPVPHEIVAVTVEDA